MLHNYIKQRVNFVKHSNQIITQLIVDVHALMVMRTHTDVSPTVLPTK